MDAIFRERPRRSRPLRVSSGPQGRPLPARALSKDRIHRMIPALEAVVPSRNRRKPPGCTAPGMEPRWGTPVLNYVAGLRPTPAVQTKD